MSSAKCPDRDQLRDYLVGRLPDDSSDALADHLEACPDCQAGLATLADIEDTLVVQLRGPLAPDPYLDEPECGQAIARAKAVVDGGEAAAHPAESPDTMLPKQLGEYQLIERLGSGSMGTVYKARHNRLDRIVALKVLPRGRTDDPRAMVRFEREMKAIGRLDHGHIVRAHDAREIDGRLVLVMEFVEGLDLRKISRGLGKLSTADACELARQAALGLQAAHEHGLVHRDIKPSNLILTPSGQVKVLDLGLARFHGGLSSSSSPLPTNLRSVPGEGQGEGQGEGRRQFPLPPGEGQGEGLESPVKSIKPVGAAAKPVGVAVELPPHRSSTADDDLTGTGQAMGTADYMAPEQAADSRAVDIRADIYSLGATLYKLLSSRAPFGGPEHQGTLDKLLAHRQEPIPPIRAFCPNIPAALAAVLDRMLAKSPDARYSTPAEVADALTPWCEGADLPALLKRATEAKDSSPLLPGEGFHKSPLPLGEGQGEGFHMSPRPLGEGQGEGLSSTQPLAASRGGRRIAAMLIALLLFGGLCFALGIMIRIHKDGKETTIEVPDGSNARVTADGQVDVTLPGKPSSEPEKAAIEDLDVVRVTALDAREPMTWQWQVHLPKGHRYAWYVAHGDIPANGIPAINFSKHTWACISNEEYWGTGLDAVLAAALRRVDDKSWAITVTSRSLNTREQFGSGSAPIPDAALRPLLDAVSVEASVLGDHETKTLKPDEPVILLMRRAHERLPEGTSQPSQKATPGFMVWLQPLTLSGEAKSAKSALGTQAASPTQKPTPPPLQFGPATELVVNAVSEGRGGEGLDLVGGKLVDVPKEFSQWSAEQQNKWSAENNVDLAVDFLAGIGLGDPKVKSLALVPEGLKLAAVWDGRWESATGEELRSALTSVTPDQVTSPDGLWTQRVSISERHGITYYVPFGGGLQTFAFQTRKGDLGILQVIRYTEEPRGMRIRYKLAKPSAAVTGVAPDEKTIQGTWEVVSSTFGLVRKLPAGNGTEFAPEEVLKTTKVVITADTLKIVGPHVTDLAFRYRLNPAAKTKMIDLKNGEGYWSVVSYGIYRLEGNELKICASPSAWLGDKKSPDAKTMRPSEFWAGLGSTEELLVLRRVGDAIATDETALVGDWQIEKASSESSPFGDPFRPGDHLVFSAYGVELRRQRAIVISQLCGYAVDSTARPKRIDLATRLVGIAWPWEQNEHGIYELEGDRLTACWTSRRVMKADDSHNAPPTKLGAPDTTVVVLKRVPAGTENAAGQAIVPEKPAMQSAASVGPQEAAKPTTYRTATVTRGDMVETINAVGTIEPEELVDVGVQVTGQIVKFGDDPRGKTDPNYKGKTIDYLSPVDEGTVLAQIDDTLYKTRRDQEKAGCERAKAELEGAKAKAIRAHALGIDVPMADAAVAAAEASVAQSEAALQQAQTNLDRTVIKSPIKGMILARRMNVGQNVAPTPNTPSLFLIAKDIEKLQVWAAINEDDIGRIKTGMDVRFTVDAYPKETFKGKVSQIRMNAHTTQNVVKYTVVVSGFENPNLKLMPYLTANVEFELANRPVLQVPIAAVRWKPANPSLVVADHQDWAKTDVDGNGLGPLWVLARGGQHVRPVKVRVGRADKSVADVSGPDVKEGMEVVDGQVGLDELNQQPDKPSSPFAPHP